jgi:hypothetical protein
MNSSTQIIIVVLIFFGSLAAAWWIRGAQKDKEFAATLASAVHIRDTSTTTTETPQPAEHQTIGPLPAQVSDAERPAIDTAIVRALRTSVDSLKGLCRYLAARMDTTIGNDRTGKVILGIDPLRRMIVADFIPPPVRVITREITDSVRVPVYVPDSFATRATIFSAGAAVAALIFMIAH